MSDVFISYSRKDIAFARLLQESLKQSQVDTWIDWERIPVGEKWWNEICEAIQNANVFMFIISNNSIGSNVCKDEINQALKNNKRIIPIIVDDLKPDVIKEFAPELPQFNWIIFARDQIFHIEENPENRSEKLEDRQVALPAPPHFDEALEKLNKAIHTDWEWVKYHTRLQVNALLWESNQRNPSYLIRGSALDESEQQLLRASGKDPRPTDLQLEFVTASRKDQTQRQQEQLQLEQKARQRQRAVIWTVGIGLVVAVVLGVLAWGQRNQAVSQGNLRATAEANAVAESHTRATAEANAVQQRDIAVVRQLAAQARNLTTGHLDEAMLLAVEAERSIDLGEARSSLLYSVASQPALRRYLPQRGWGWSNLAYSPDGNLLAMGTVDGSVLLLDASSGEPVTAPLSGLSSEVLSLAFSPDGHFLAAGDNNGLVLHWDISNPASPVQEAVYNVGPHTKRELATYASGLMLYTGTSVSNIYLWNTPTSQLVQICLCGVTSLRFAPDGSSLAAGMGNGDVNLLDFPSGQVKQDLPAYSGMGITPYMVLDLAFSPDGNKLVVSTVFSSIRIWDLTYGAALPPLSMAVGLSRLALSPDGKTLAYTLNGESAVYLMDMDSQQSQKYPLPSGAEVTSMAFNPDGQRLALGMVDNTIQLWDVQNHQPLGTPFNGHHGEVINLVFNPDGHRLVSIDWEHTTIMWDLQADERLLTTTKIASDSVTNIARSADGRYIATGSNTGEKNNLNILDTHTSPPAIQTLTETELGLSPIGSDLYFLPNSHTLVLAGTVSSSSDNQIIFRDLDTRQTILKISSASSPLALSSDGRWLAGIATTGGSQPSQIAVWDAHTGTLARDLSGSTSGDQVSSIAFNLDGSLVAAGFDNGSLRLWRVEDGQPASDVLAGHPDMVTGLAFSPDGKTLASSSRDKTIRLWNVADPATAPVELDGHTGWVTGVAFSPDGKTLVSSSLDGSIRLWDSQSYLNIGQLTGLGIAQQFSPIFSSDGSTLYAGGTGVMEQATPTTLAMLADRGLVAQWVFGPAKWDGIACAIAQRNFSLNEWRSYFGTKAYHKTCANLPLHPSVVEKFIQSEQTKLGTGGKQAALNDFVTTLPLDPTLAGELETSLDTFPVDDVMLNAAQHMNTGDATPAVEMYQALHALGADKRVSADTWNGVCWLGSLWGQAQKVLDICNLAVSLEPSNASIRDSRGLALAITGKTQAAIADFQALVDWCQQNGCSDTLGSQREQWIAALKSGQNPFNEQLLQSLRNQ